MRNIFMGYFMKPRSIFFNKPVAISAYIGHSMTSCQENEQSQIFYFQGAMNLQGKMRGENYFELHRKTASHLRFDSPSLFLLNRKATWLKTKRFNCATFKD